MALEAQFTCKSIMQTVGSPGSVNVEVTLDAYTGIDEDNVAWSKFTPSGKLTMHITNPDARGFFEPGSDYRLVITKRQPSKSRANAA